MDLKKNKGISIWHTHTALLTGSHTLTPDMANQSQHSCPLSELSLKIPSNTTSGGHYQLTVTAPTMDPVCLLWAQGKTQTLEPCILGLSPSTR